jgi:hypothetical protein
MMFRANPKPTDGQWSINGASIAVGSESLDQKYKSSFIEDGVSSFFMILIRSEIQIFVH